MKRLKEHTDALKEEFGAEEIDSLKTVTGSTIKTIFPILRRVDATIASNVILNLVVWMAKAMVSDEMTKEDLVRYRVGIQLALLAVNDLIEEKINE